jgi:hypothetical protein
MDRYFDRVLLCRELLDDILRDFQMPNTQSTDKELADHREG